MPRWKNLSAAFISGTAVVALIAIPNNQGQTVSVSQASEVSNLPSKKPTTKTPATPATSLSEVVRTKQSPVAEKWLSALQSDAFGNQVIFENLSTYEPITNILKKGIVSYHRKTLRTPNYREEGGYDLLVYEIQHPLSVQSKVMAYFEHRAGELPVLKIVFLTGRPGQSTGELVQLENGTIGAHREVAWAEAQALFESELADASTLMSASVR